MKFDINSKKSKNKRNYKQAMDLNVDRYGQSATQDNFAFTKTNMKKESSFKMKGFSGFGVSPAKMKFDPARDVVNFREGVAYTPKGKVKANINVDKISKRPASTFDKSLGNARNSAKQQRKAMGKVGRKVAGKIGSKFLGPVGVGLAVKDAIGSYKDIKKGMKPGKALRKNFLGF